MREVVYEYIELPSDPKDLTREIALKVFERPEVFIHALARLAITTEHPTPQRVVPSQKAAQNA